MRVQLASDLHLEFYDSVQRGPDFFRGLVDPATDADLLVLAGDIGYPEAPITRDFIGWCCANWPLVVWVYGNHEYYAKKKQPLTMSQKEGEGFKMECAHSNLTVLCEDTLELEDTGVTVIGTTLWTDLTDEEAALLRSGMNDFEMIWSDVGGRFTVEEWRRRNAEGREFLETRLEEIATLGQRALVVTHHLPSKRMVQPQYADHPLNCGFAGKADALVDHPAVAAWCCGHSHGQISVGKCHLNARGYPHEGSVATYNPRFVIEV